jgi:hypothetical protein
MQCQRIMRRSRLRAPTSTLPAHTVNAVDVLLTSSRTVALHDDVARGAPVRSLGLYHTLDGALEARWGTRIRTPPCAAFLRPRQRYAGCS